MRHSPPLALVGQAVATPVVLLVLYFIVPLGRDRWLAATALGLVSAAAVLPLTVRRLGRIRTSDHPVGEAMAAISLLTSLVVVGFAIGYYSLATHTDQIPGIHTRLDSLYFTVTTLSTVGYGDITAEGQTARAFVTAQILLNLTLIAGGLRLVAGAARDRREVTGR